MHIYMYIYSAYAHPVASVKQMRMLIFTTSVLRTHLHIHGAQQHLWMHADSLQKCIWTYTYTYIHVHLHMYTCIHIYIHVHIHTHTHTYIHGYIYIYIRIHMYICIYLYTYAYAHIYTYISISVAYAHPVASVKQMCTLMFTTSV